MEYIRLIGILIVIVGFALKLDSILIIFLAAVTTALAGGLGISGLLDTLGSSFVSNRSMAIFIIILFVTGTLERNACGKPPPPSSANLKTSPRASWCASTA